MNIVILFMIIFGPGLQFKTQTQISTNKFSENIVENIYTKKVIKEYWIWKKM